MQSSDSLRRSIVPWAFALLICAATILAYRPSWNGGFIWDDDAYVTRNPLLVAPDGLRRIWFSLDAPSQYFPLTYTVFSVERALWGLNPPGYHWTNLLLHVANALLVWLVLARLKIPGAPLAAAIFALHPVQVESVAWITELKNVLMGFFFLLTLLAWIEFLETQSKRRWLIYATALIFTSLALSAKTTACTLPPALLLVLWLRKDRVDRWRLIETIPFFGLAFVAGLMAIWWERFHQGTRGALFVLGPVERLLVATRAIWFYASKLFWPSDLTFIYPQWTINERDPVAYVWILGIVAVGILTYFTRRFIGRGIETAMFFFVVTLGPLLGFIMLYTFRYTFVADHYQYLASVGPIAVVSAGIAQLQGSTRYGRYVASLLGVSILGTLWLLTLSQSSNYRNIEILWRTTIARNPGCWMAYNNLGVALVEKGKVDAAISEYQRSLQLHPDYAEAHYNLGTALLQIGRTDEAIAECNRALALQPKDPDAHVALGNALLAKKNVDEAISHYEVALQLRPEDAVAHYNLGNALLEKGQSAEAVRHYETALVLQPNIAQAHTQLGNVFLRNGDARGAMMHYRAALELSPSSAAAQSNLAWVLATAADRSIRDGATAVELADRANSSSNQSDPLTLQVLAAAHAQVGRFDEAVATAQRALDLVIRQGQLDLAEELRREIALYKDHSAFREP